MYLYCLQYIVELSYLEFNNVRLTVMWAVETERETFLLVLGWAGRGGADVIVSVHTVGLSGLWI